MKKIILLSLILFNSICSFSQKNVDVDNVNLKVTYKISPTKPLNPLFFDYYTELNTTKTIEKRVSLDELERAFYIGSQNKIDDMNQALVVAKINLGDLIVKESRIVERKVEDTDRDGKVTGTRYYFRVEVTYTFEASYLVTKGKEKLEESQLAARDRNLHFQTDEYADRKEASDYWSNNRDMLIDQITKDNCMQAVSYVSSTLTAKYGFPIQSKYDIIKTIDEKKHPENEAFRAASASLKEILEAMTPEEPMDKSRAEGLIEYFKSIPEKYTDPKLKADVRLRYAAYYNLCKIYLYLDQPENIDEYAAAILINGFDKDDCGKAKKAAMELKTILDRTEVKTRHFNPEEYFN